MREVKSLRLEKYVIVYTDSTMFIGCKKHLIEEWRAFSDEEINWMGIGALELWRKWKTTIFQIIEMSPATRSERRV